VAYVGAVAKVWRQAIDQQQQSPTTWHARADWQATLSAHAEGHQTTLGPYHRAWH
jgi:putative protease